MLYCQDRQRLEAAGAAVPANFRVLTASTVEDCVRGIPAAVCLVVIATHESGADVRRLRRARFAAPGVSIVLVVPHDREALRLFSPIGPDIVVWSDQAADDLRRAIDRAVGSTLLGQAASRIETAPDVPTPLRRALMTACRASPPIVSVAALAREAGISPRWLETLWRRQVSERGRRAKDFLDWIVLVHAWIGLNRNCGRSELPALLGRSAQTLERIAQRVLDRTMAEVARLPATAISGAFRSQALDPVLPDQALRGLK